MRRVLRKRINLLRLLLIGMPVALFSNECDARSLSVSVNILTRDSLRNDTLKGGELQEVTVTATRFLFVTKKDTTIYDLDALHLKSGAPLREAFEKLPGMSFRGGKLYHNGREVKRVLINGMDFSHKDPMLALQALPSYIMKDVKVYERKSDFAMRYDTDDGREELVADVSVRRKYMGTWTGELAAGGGTDKRFMGRGYGNIFTDRFRVSLFGNANNINEQMWYGGDGKERAGEVQAGDNRFYTPGGTFFWKNKKGVADKGYFLLEGGADYNREMYDKEESRHSELFLSDGNMFSASDNRQETQADRLAGHLKADWNISKLLTLNYSGSFDAKWSRNISSALKANWNENPVSEGGSIADTLKYLLTAGSDQPKAIDLQHRENGFDANDFAYNHTLRLSYKIPQSKKSRIFLTFAHKMNLGNSDSESQDNTYYKYFNDEAGNSMRINRLLDKNGHHTKQGVMGRMMQYFDVKGFRRFCLYTEYNYDRTVSASDEHGSLPHLGETGGSRGVTDDETTRRWKSWTGHHSIKESLSGVKGIYSFQLDAAYNYRRDEMNYAKRSLPLLSPRKNYHYLTLHASFRMRSEKTGTLFAQYDVAPDIPDIISFVTYPDKADPQYIILGNDKLEMGQLHVLTAWYSRNFTTERAKGKVTRTLSAHIAFFRRNNAVTDFTTYDRTTGVVTVKPVNVSGNWDGKANIGFTTPFDVAQRFWLETFAEASVQRTQTYSGVVTADNMEQQFNDNRFYSYTATLKPRLKLVRVDLSAAYELTLENNKGTYASANNGTQWQHHLLGKMNWILPWKLNFDATLNYHNYTGYLSGKRENRIMWDMGIERTFLKNENLFVRISGHDLCNQNNGFVRQYSATALTHTCQKTLGRYGMLTLRYRFASKKK